METAALNGKALYIDSSLINVKNGGFLHFKTTITANTGKTFILGSDGFMTSFNNCGVTPTPTPSISITQTPSISISVSTTPPISLTPSISVTPSISISPPASISVAGVGGGSSYDGFDYYVTGFVSLNGNVAVSTNFSLSVNTVGGAILVSVLVPAGTNFGSGITLYGSSNPEPIGTACIVFCEDPNIILTGYVC